MKFRICAVMAALALLPCGCGPLLGAPLPERKNYVLEGPQCSRTEQAREGRPSLLVSDPMASSLVNSERIIFGQADGTRGSYQLAGWTEPPPRRLALLMINDLECSGQFATVTRKSTMTSAALLLNTEILDLYHDISSSPGEVRFSARVELINLESRSVAATRTFDERAPAGSFDARGAVEGVKKVTAQFLADLREWLAAEAAHVTKKRLGSASG